MTQEQIDSIRERLCDEYCRWFPRLPVTNALDIICEDCPLNELEEGPRWIPVKEQLPNDGQRVLLSSRGGVELVTWGEEIKHLHSSCWEVALAWMPLPEPYEED